MVLLTSCCIGLLIDSVRNGTGNFWQCSNGHALFLRQRLLKKVMQRMTGSYTAFSLLSGE